MPKNLERSPPPPPPPPSESTKHQRLVCMYKSDKWSDHCYCFVRQLPLTSGDILRHYLRAQSQEHHYIDRLEERGVERGSVRRSSLKGRERAIVSQTNIGTVSKATLGKLRDGVGAHMGYSERIDTILN